MSKQPTNLKLSQVKKKSKEIDQTEKHEILQGEYIGEQITFFPTFSDVKIEELVEELQDLHIEAKDKGIELSEKMHLYLIQLLMIKHFSHFKSDLPSGLLGKTKSSAGLLDHLDHFRKTGLLQEFINNIFLPKEMQKVLDKVSELGANLMFIQEMNEEMQRKFETLKIKNKDVFEQISDLENNIIQ